jgi:hypothetical protein
MAEAGPGHWLSGGKPGRIGLYAAAGNAPVPKKKSRAGQAREVRW